MEGTGYLFIHSQHRNVWCHCCTTTMQSDGDDCVPMHLEPYVKKESCAYRAFRTKNELTVELVDKTLEHIRPLSSLTHASVFFLCMSRPM